MHKYVLAMKNDVRNLWSRKLLSLLVIATMSTVLVACHFGSDTEVETITLKDASSVEVTVAKYPQRIVSIAPAETEVLFALGLGDRVVGVTEWCDYPAEAKNKAKVGDMTTNLESIIALEPDLIVGGYTLNKDAVDSLRELNQTVFTVEPKTIDEAMSRIETIGVLTGREKAAAAVIDTMKQERKKVVDAVSTLTADQKKDVYLEFDPMWTVGKGEFGHDLLGLANANNIAGELKSWVEINDEFVIKQNPDVIIYASYSLGDGKQGDDIKKRNGWSAIQAVKNNRVVGIDANLVSRPGPRMTKGLMEIAKGVYPELVE